jgi:hypothetical protein
MHEVSAEITFDAGTTLTMIGRWQAPGENLKNPLSSMLHLGFTLTQICDSSLYN